MKILVADKFPARHLDRLQGLGLPVSYEPDLETEALAAAAADASVLIVRGTKVDRAVFEKGRALSLVVRAGAGVNTIDLDAASERGVYVTNCPGKNAVAVAELAIGLLIALDRRIPDAVADFRAGKWDKKEYGKADGLFGKALGVVGFGQIGIEVASRAAAFGLRVSAWSRSLTTERASALGIGWHPSPLELASSVDAVSVHLALTPDTRGLLDRRFFGAMRPGGYFVNTARAEVVDEVAMIAAVREKGIRVATDVFEGEPKEATGSVESELQTSPVYVTHHIGASTEQAQDAVAAEAVRIVRTFLSTGEVLHCVNLRDQSPARAQLVVRHEDRPGVLAGVLDVLRRAGINVEEMDNQVFRGAKAAVARVRVAERPGDAVVSEIRSQPAVIHLDVIDL